MEAPEVERNHLDYGSGENLHKVDAIVARTWKLEIVKSKTFQAEKSRNKSRKMGKYSLCYRSVNIYMCGFLNTEHFQCRVCHLSLSTSFNL